MKKSISSPSEVRDLVLNQTKDSFMSLFESTDSIYIIQGKSIKLGIFD